MMDLSAKALNFDQLVHNRRSIRKYKTIEPSPEAIQTLLACAAQAPSPSNSQPVRFAHLCSRAIRQQLEERLKAGYQHLLDKHTQLQAPAKLKTRLKVYWRFSQFMTEAPSLFAVGYQKDYKSLSHYLAESHLITEGFRGETDALIAIGISLCHFVFKAEDLGLSTCILTAPLVIAPDIQSIWDRTDIETQCFVTLGYADEAPSAPPKQSGSEIYQAL